MLLSHGLKKPREYLLAHPETELPKSPSFMQSEESLGRRVGREPLAYILGEKEFYGRTFFVNKNVLIPRPESESIIELLKEQPLSLGSTLVDVGTGSGALAITAKLEMPHLLVRATDISQKALAVARKNARSLQASIDFITSDLLTNLQEPPVHVIVANLPYVATNWTVSPETSYEPRDSLFAEDGGLILIKRLITQTATTLHNGGYLLLEADPRQHHKIKAYAKDYRLQLTAKSDFILQFNKI